MPVNGYKFDSVEELINLTGTCSCGRKHSCGLRSFFITESGAEDLIPELIEDYGAEKIHFISSAADMPLLGERVFSRMCTTGYRVSSSVFPAESGFVCDHVSAGDLLIHVPEQTQLVVAVGEKTICDLAKFVSTKNRVPLLFLPSSASSDTFSMPEAEFTENDHRRRLSIAAPEVIIADIKALQQAPLEKTGAGIASVLADLVSLADWELSASVTGSFFCRDLHDRLLGMCRNILTRIENGVSPRDGELMRDLISCLVAGGVISDLIGSEVPVRGTESAIARHAEMILVSEDITDVSFEMLRGASAVYSARFFEYLRKAELSFDEAKAGFNDIDRVYFHKELIRVFGEKEGHRILSSFGGINYYQREGRFRRLDLLRDNPDLLSASLKADIPSSSRLSAVLRSVSVPVSFRELGLTEEEIYDILVWSKELSGGYGVARFLADFLLLEQAVSDCFLS